MTGAKVWQTVLVRRRPRVNHRSIMATLLVALQVVPVALAGQTEVEAEPPSLSPKLFAIAARDSGLLNFPSLLDPGWARAHLARPRLHSGLAFSLSWQRGNPDTFLKAYAERFYGPRRIEFSRLDYALHGAGTGATMGMLAGAMGSAAGIWDDRTGWYLAGATTVLGAILGGTTKPDDGRARVHLRWEP